MIDNNKIARDAFTTTQRAFITVANFDMSVRFGTDPINKGQVIKYWWFTPNIKNSGNTPTKNMIYVPIASCASNPMASGAHQAFNCEYGRPDEPGDPEDVLNYSRLSKISIGTTIVGPQSTVPIGGFGVTEDFIKAIQKGYPWYFYGIVQYNDIFPNSALHVTKFCYHIRGDTSENGVLMPGYDFCNHWNCADDECKDDRKSWDEQVAAGKIRKPMVLPPPVPASPK